MDWISYKKHSMDQHITQPKAHCISTRYQTAEICLRSEAGFVAVQATCGMVVGECCAIYTAAPAFHYKPVGAGLCDYCACPLTTDNEGGSTSLVDSSCATQRPLPPAAGAEAGISNDPLLAGTCRSSTSSSAVGGSCDTAEGLASRRRVTPEPALLASQADVWHEQMSLPTECVLSPISLDHETCTASLRHCTPIRLAPTTRAFDPSSPTSPELQQDAPVQACVELSPACNAGLLRSEPRQHSLTKMPPASGSGGLAAKGSA